jgi:hypothetical protein
MAPPWAWAIHWAIASPRPKPPRSDARERARSARQNRSKMKGRSAARDAEAGVVHREGRLVTPSLQGHRHRAVPPVYLTAFVIRLRNSCRSRTGSPSTCTGSIATSDTFTP